MGKRAWAWMHLLSRRVFWGAIFFCWLALVGILEVLDLETFGISGLYIPPKLKLPPFLDAFKWFCFHYFPGFFPSFSGFFVFSTAMNPCHCWRDLKSGWTCRDAGTWRLSWSKDLCNWKFVEALWRLVGWLPGCSIVGAAWFVRNKTRKDFFTKVFLTKVWKGFCFFNLVWKVQAILFKDVSSKVSKKKTPPAQGPVHHPESMALRIFSDRIRSKYQARGLKSGRVRVNSPWILRLGFTLF